MFSKKISKYLMGIVTASVLAGCGGGGGGSSTSSSTTEYTLKSFVENINSGKPFLTIEYATIGNYPNSNYNTEQILFGTRSSLKEYDSADKNFYETTDEGFELEYVDENTYRTLLNGQVNDICTVLSKEKVTNLMNLTVDTYAVKQFCTYEEVEWENKTGSFSSLEQVKDSFIANNTSLGEESLKITEDGKVKDSLGNVIDGSSWVIEDNYLKIKYYDEIWYKIEDGVLKEGWVADTIITYDNVAEEKSQKIVSKLVGYTDYVLPKQGLKYSIFKENGEYMLQTIKFDNNKVYSSDDIVSENSLIETGAYTIEDGMIKETANNDTWYDKIVEIYDDYIEECSLSIGETSCGQDKKVYIYSDSEKAQQKLSELQAN